MEIFELDVKAGARVLSLMQRYNDWPMDLADASRAPRITCCAVEWLRCALLGCSPIGLIGLGRWAPCAEALACLRRFFAVSSLLILAERLGHGRIRLTDQRNFEAHRWKNHHPFENLLLA